MHLACGNPCPCYTLNSFNGNISYLCIQSLHPTFPVGSPGRSTLNSGSHILLPFQPYFLQDLSPETSTQPYSLVSSVAISAFAKTLNVDLPCDVSGGTWTAPSSPGEVSGFCMDEEATLPPQLSMFAAAALSYHAGLELLW